VIRQQVRDDIVGADREALGGAITEINTTAVTTAITGTIDNPDVEMGASTSATMVVTTAAPTPTQLGCTRCATQHSCGIAATPASGPTAK
jgi:hypothetical protein